MRKTKRDYFENIKINNITDKKFWQTAKPPVSDKINHMKIINLIDNGATLSHDKEIVETFDIFVTLLKTYHNEKIFLLKSRQWNCLLTQLYLHCKNMHNFHHK